MTEEFNETIQDVIDRLLYLPEDKLKEYKHNLDLLVRAYPIEMEVMDGVRTYESIKNL